MILGVPILKHFRVINAAGVLLSKVLIIKNIGGKMLMCYRIDGLHVKVAMSVLSSETICVVVIFFTTFFYIRLEHAGSITYFSGTCGTL